MSGDPIQIPVPTITFSDIPITEGQTDEFIKNFNEKGTRLDQYSVQLTALAQAIGQALTDAQGIADNAGTAAANIATNAVLAALQDLVNEVESKVAGFHDLYLGAKPVDPTVDDDGDALLAGAFYFNVSSLKMRVYNGTTWQDSAAVATSVTLNQISDLTASPAEINRIKGLTAPIQELLDSTTERFQAVTSTANSTIIDAEAATVFSHALTESTTFTFNNAPAGGAYGFTLKIVQDASASGYAITWPASVVWPGGKALELTAEAGAIDVVIFYTEDAGATWLGFIAGQGMA